MNMRSLANMRLFLKAAMVLILSSTVSSCCDPLPDEGPMPELTGAQTWFNTQPLTNADLRGRVVLIDFWTYSCVNCLRVLPYVKAWEAKYRDKGLVVIGVHAPEFDFEEDTANVKAAMARLGITYPVVLDNDMKLWNAFNNRFWPAHYFIDVEGRIRYHHFGEGGYEQSEQVIRRLLADVPKANRVISKEIPPPLGRIDVPGHAVAAEETKGRSPETYIGYLRASRMTSTPEIRKNVEQLYVAPSTFEKDAWALDGSWLVAREYGETCTSGASIVYQFFGRDINLVLGSAIRDTPVRFRVTIDGNAPGEDAGMDVDADGYGVITEQRMYQLFRHKRGTRAGTFKIVFEGPGARAYAFTFG